MNNKYYSKWTIIKLHSVEIYVQIRMLGYQTWGTRKTDCKHNTKFSIKLRFVTNFANLYNLKKDYWT